MAGWNCAKGRINAGILREETHRCTPSRSDEAIYFEQWSASNQWSAAVLRCVFHINMLKSRPRSVPTPIHLTSNWMNRRE